MKARSRSLKGGLSFVEILAAAAIIGVSLTALIGLFFFGQNMVDNSDDVAVGVNLARQRIEIYRALGFRYAPEGAMNLYYDRSALNPTVSQGSSSYFHLNGNVSSDRLEYNASLNAYYPNDLALRTVTVTVTRVSDGRIMAKLVTYLARSGI